MQDEVAKHTKKIYRTMKSHEHSFWEKTREIAIEIFIIVFAVTLSIWLHSWSDHQHEQKEAKEFLLGLKDDLSKDIQLLEANRKTFVQLDTNFNLLAALDDTRAIDTTSGRKLYDLFDFEERVTHPNIGRYEGFKSSGKIGTIENDSLKQLILAYYQQTMTSVQDDESFVNAFQTKMLDLMVDRDYKSTLRDLAKSFKMRASLEIIDLNLKGAINAYRITIQQAKGIIALIDRIYGVSKN
jgi:hypothetical protein